MVAVESASELFFLVDKNRLKSYFFRHDSWFHSVIAVQNYEKLLN